MDLPVSTYALLFPAVSLLFLSYTNRFLHLSALIRKLHSDWVINHDDLLICQIENLSKRLNLIRWMQFLWAVCLLLSVTAMLVKLAGFSEPAVYLFISALCLMKLSLLALSKEVWISGGALKIVLAALSKDLNEEKAKGS